MKIFYYILWVDSILSFKKFNPKRTDWKVAIFILNTWINALNFWIVFIWLKFFNILDIPLISINLFPGTILDKVVAFTIEFALPFGILNYFLIFHNNRYKKMIEKYANIKFRYALIYSLIIIAGAFLSAIVYGILT